MLEISRENILKWSKIGCAGVFAIAADYLASVNDKFNIVLSDLYYFSGFTDFSEKYKDRIYNVGIAEQNEIGLATGLVNEGYTVYAPTYSGFTITRALDQVKVSMGYMKLPIKVIAMDSGLTDGSLGPTHMSIEDISIARAIPNLTVLSPCDGLEFMKMLFAINDYGGPVYLSAKLANSTDMPIVYETDFDYKIGKSNIVYGKPDDDIVIFATGPMVYNSIEACKKLRENNINCKVINIHTIKPFDNEVIKENINAKVFITIEENMVTGGIGSLILEELSAIHENKSVYRIGINDMYPHAGRYEDILLNIGLDIEHIADRISKIVDEVNCDR